MRRHAMCDGTDAVILSKTVVSRGLGWWAGPWGGRPGRRGILYRYNMLYIRRS